jgi:TolA-binding protein
MKLLFKAWSTLALFVLALAASTPARAQETPPALSEVLVYPTKADGSIMDWLAISPLPYNAAYIGDSMSYDVFKTSGGNELTLRPRAGDVVAGQAWHKMHWTGTTEGPAMCNLFDVAGKGMWQYGITACTVYFYSPAEHPNAIFSGSSDDALKVILNGRKIWSNQIQRSPTYDSDQCAAPIRKGWNSMMCVVDQVVGGHLLCARFLDGDKPVTDLKISLDPPAEDARRFPAAPYNASAAELMRSADALRADGKLEPALAAYDQVVARYPLSDVAPRALYARANVYYSADGSKSLNKPEDAVAALDALLNRYGQDLLAEYALLELGQLQASPLNDLGKATATYRSFETRFPHSSLAAKSQVELAKLLAQQKKFEDAILIYRRVIKQYPQSDEVMTATVGIADAYRLAGEKEKAQAQYKVAQTMATDWHDNKYGIDVGKQAWLRGILDYLRTQLPS